jgi:hypothetical protein
MAKQRVHTFAIRVTMDRKCSKRHALREVRDCLQASEHYTTAWNDGDPESFRVLIRNIKSGDR